MRRVALVLLAPLLLLAGLWLGGHPSLLPEPVRDAFVADDTAVLTAALDRIDEEFVREVPRDRLVDGAIRGAVGSLGDEFSAYFSAEEYTAYQDASHSRFSGVGLAVQEDPRGLLVTRVYDGSPARAAGLREGDVITHADGRPLAGMPREAAVERVKGPAGTRVRLRLRRDGRVVTREVTRATVSVPVVETEVRDTPQGPVGVLALASFTSGAHAELHEALRRLQDRGVQGLVLDLRGNPGGYLPAAVEVAGAFVAGEEVVSVGADPETAREYTTDDDPIAPDLPLAVLVDEGSASASEIVAGALQDLGRAEIVGETTFGKGTVQTIAPLPGDAGGLKLTTARYYTPDGTSIDGVGVRPDTEVASVDGTTIGPEDPEEPQLAAARRVLADQLAAAGGR